MPNVPLSDTELAEVIRGLGLVARQYREDAERCESGSVRSTFENAADYCDRLAERLKEAKGIKGAVSRK